MEPLSVVAIQLFVNQCANGCSKSLPMLERLLADLNDLDWPESIKDMQRNWIGKSTGPNVTFKVKGTDKESHVFTTRPDTLFGATFTVLAPEHDL